MFIKFLYSIKISEIGQWREMSHTIVFYNQNTVLFLAQQKNVKMKLVKPQNLLLMFCDLFKKILKIPWKIHAAELLFNKVTNVQLTLQLTEEALSQNFSALSEIFHYIYLKLLHIKEIRGLAIPSTYLVISCIISVLGT